MNRITIAAAAFVAAITLSVTTASAGCMSKAAVATAGSADSAKWYALETMVQAVSWGLWPGFVATNKVEGHVVKNESTSVPRMAAKSLATAARRSARPSELRSKKLENTGVRRTSRALICCCCTLARDVFGRFSRSAKVTTQPQLFTGPLDL
jgi:hypothetical protein